MRLLQLKTSHCLQRREKNVLGEGPSVTFYRGSEWGRRVPGVAWCVHSTVIGEPCHQPFTLGEVGIVTVSPKEILHIVGTCWTNYVKCFTMLLRNRSASPQHTRFEGSDADFPPSWLDPEGVGFPANSFFLFVAQCCNHRAAEQRGPQPSEG